MRISVEIVSKLKPRKSHFNNFKDHYPDFSGNLEDFILLENITYSDKVWVVTRLFTRQQNIKWSLLCASKVLSIFEEKYPQDKRPRLALEATENYMNNPSEENRQAAYDAAYAACAAAYDAAYDAACAAAYDAAYDAAYAACAAAYDAANAAYATDSAAYAAYAAANAAYATDADATAAYAKDLEEQVNLILMVECL